MTTYLRRTKPNATGLAVSAAELEIANTAELQATTHNRGRGNRTGTRQIPTASS